MPKRAARSEAMGSPPAESKLGDEVAVAKPTIPVPTSRERREEKSDRESGGTNGHTSHMMPPIVSRPAPSAGRDYYRDYEYADLDEITMRQLSEDILAYNYDLDYCKAQLEDMEADLTPQETRTLQLRTLDLGHQIRHCKHRIETIRVQTRKQPPRHSYGGMVPVASHLNHGINGTTRQQHRSSSGGGSSLGVGLPPARRMAPPHPATMPSGSKRPMYEEDEGPVAKRAKMAASPDLDGGMDDGVNTALQRLGFWKCRLCSAPKYLLAGAGRSPAAPCKWPLKDISKMITHFTEMHAEHTPPERCVELGAALAQNRGPFEYWLRRTRAQNISDGSVIDNCIDALCNGDMPDLLRRHSRAAAGMPVY
ncbi:hypothetical protein N0V88_005723 [Collariella sp. IMI 366227]|nr:hypothetical protein N0V88_005723 [Collariella sp. IMI 366227]